jgi:hypothetical protein
MPKTVLYDCKFQFMTDAVELYPSVRFVEWAHTDDIDKEYALVFL